MMITMYHGCRLESWDKCVEQGYLLHQGLGKDPLVYLATDLEEAICHGTVVLEVQFDPEVDRPNNYHPDCWQCRVYKGIPLDRVRVLTKTAQRIVDCVYACGGIEDTKDVLEAIRLVNELALLDVKLCNCPLDVQIDQIASRAKQLVLAFVDSNAVSNCVR